MCPHMSRDHFNLNNFHRFHEDIMHTKEHWENVYRTKATDAVSWFQEHAKTSLNLIQTLSLEKNASIIDVGGGASTLVDDLLLAGYSHLSVLDLSSSALEASKNRIGSTAEKVNWIEADITKVNLSEHQFDLWHDRAVFHFLTSAEDRVTYVKTLLGSLTSGGHAIIVTFAENGPIQCSGLPVMRYSAQGLHAELGDSFVLVEERYEKHETPFGTVQEFLYCHFVRVG